MAAGKVIGQIQVTEGNIKVVGVDGAVREPGYEGYVYENEQVISNDPNALFQIKFLALPEASAYDGVFRILADGSVIHGRDAMDSMMSDENLVKVLETAAGEENIEDLETAAGEESADGSSLFTETDIVAESSVLGFNRGANGELGYGIVDFGSVPNYDAGQIAPPAITSPNVVIYDENDTIPVIQITATAEGSVTYSIGGLDSGFFDIDSATGLVTFKESPDFENPRDSGGDNEYNTYVTVTDTYGNYTTQLLSVSINNVNEPVTAVDDTVDAVEDTILSSTIDLDANDYDVDGDNLTVVAGTFATAKGGEIVIAADGSYTYTPALNFNGTDTVDYTVTDGEFSDVGTLTINVNATADLPILSMEITKTPKTEIITEYQTVIDTERNEEAGIYLGEDGKYYIDTTEVIDGVVYSGKGPTLNNGHYITYEQTIELADVLVLNTKFTGNSNATVKFYEGEAFVYELPLLGGVNTYTPGGSFNNIIFVVDEQTSAIFLKSYSFEKIITTETQPYTMEVPVETEVTTYEYTIATDAQLTDEDEELSEIELGGIPEGVDLIDNGDGTYTFESETQLSPDVLDGITATVTSTEDSNGDEATVTVNQNGIVSIVAGSGNDAMEYDEYDTFDTEIDGGDGFDTVIGSSEEIDLSNVSNIEVIQLNSGATVIGSGEDNSINPDDVLSATDGGTLIIQSDGGDASTQAYADSTFGDATMIIADDGNRYAQYTDGTATLLIQIEDIVVPT